MKTKYSAVLLLPLLALLFACHPRPQVTPIGLIQAIHATNSAWFGRNVAMRGIAVEPVLWISGRGEPVRAMVLQNSAKTGDDNPDTADGLPIIVDPQGNIPSKEGFVTLARGDEIIVHGRIEYFDGQLVLNNVFLVRLLRHAVDLDSETPTFEVRPPDNAAEASLYWAKHLGMRCTVPAGSEVQGVFQDEVRKVSGLNLIRPDAHVMGRTNVYARRVFRDAHPLDDHPESLFDNDNGYRFLLGDAGLKAAANDTAAMLPVARTLSTMTETVTGVVLSLQGRFAVHVDSSPRLERGPDPAMNHPFQAADREGRLALASYNFENLYDFRDDPFDQRDYAAGSVTNIPPILNDYVPADENTYRERLRGLAGQIINDLHTPDILIVQEIEDQDIGTVVDGRLVVGSVDQADGELDVLQELALEIQQQGGPLYRSLCDRAAADNRGIVCAFLYRPDRFEPVPPDAVPDAGSLFQEAASRGVMRYRPRPSNPTAVNEWMIPFGLIFDRAPQYAIFHATAQAGGASTPNLILIANHFRSNPSDAVELRREQARFNAELAGGFLKRDPQALVMVAGDLNTYPRPDEPIPAAPSDQLGPLYDAGLHSVYDDMLARHPEAAYSYIYDGQTQTLDHQFLSPALRERMIDVWIEHINSDFKHVRDEPRRGVSDHDPMITCYRWP